MREVTAGLDTQLIDTHGLCPLFVTLWMSDVQMYVILTALYVFVFACRHAHIYILCLLLYTYMYIHMCVYVFIFMCVHILMYMWICISVFVCLYIYVLLIFGYTVCIYKWIKYSQKNIHIKNFYMLIVVRMFYIFFNIWIIKRNLFWYNFFLFLLYIAAVLQVSNLRFLVSHFQWLLFCFSFSVLVHFIWILYICYSQFLIRCNFS